MTGIDTVSAVSLRGVREVVAAATRTEHTQGTSCQDRHTCYDFALCERERIVVQYNDLIGLVQRHELGAYEYKLLTYWALLPQFRPQGLDM